MNVDAARRKYRRNVMFYGLADRPTRRIREEAIGLLRLRPGGIVLDLGCGTGLSFPLLERGIGPEGRVIGVDASPDMLSRARDRVARAAWSNVTLEERSADTLTLPPASVDAVLAFYTHDVMQSDEAMRRAWASLRPGGVFVAAGVKRAGGPLSFPRNALTKMYSRPAVTSFAGFDRPWHILERVAGPLNVEPRLLDTAYIASGMKPRKFDGTREDTMERDPICGMDVDPKSAAATSEYQGKTYYFCAPGCKKEFDANPGRYVAK